MLTAPRITFRGVAPSDAIAAYVRRRAAKLETFSDRITDCHVVIDADKGHGAGGAGGSEYGVRVELHLPGGDLVADRPAAVLARRDAYAAIDAAFDDAGRLVQDHVRRQRGDVKTHAQRHPRG